MLTMSFLGTGAADWPPEYAATAAATTAGQVRGNAALLVNDQVLIDCGPTVPAAMRLLGIEPHSITDLLITHTHGDHLDPKAIQWLADARLGEQPLRIWLDRGSQDSLGTLTGVDIHPLEVARPVGLNGLTIVPLAANHVVRPGEQALHFLFEQRGHSALYATDGAWLLKDTWQYLCQTHLEAIVWDATNGETQGDWRIFEHNSVDMIRIMMQTLRKQAVLAPGCQVLLTHLARTLCAAHEELKTRLAPEGLTPAHDGLVVALPDGNRGH